MLTSEQMEFIRRNMKKISIDDLAKKFNVHRNAIVGVISNFKNREFWTLEQDKFLVENKDNMTINEISQKIEKSFGSIFQKLRRLGLKKKNFSSNFYFKKGSHSNNEFPKGHIPITKDKTREEVYGKEKAEKLKNKASDTMKRLYSEGKIIAWKTNLTNETDERVKRSSKKMKETKNSEEWKNTKGKEVSEKMKNGGGLKARKGNKLFPNKPETILINIIKENNLPFNYVGAGSIWFRGETQAFNPDFLSKNPKHIIEMFGDYWHNLPKVKLRDVERLRTYSKYGYKTLIIWEHELIGGKYGRKLSTVEIINKIKGFLGWKNQ